MKKNIFTRVLCAFLTVLMLVTAIPALTVSAAEETNGRPLYEQDITTVTYKNADERLAGMTLYYDNADYALYVDVVDDPTTQAVESTGIVAYVKKATGEILFTNPWNVTEETNSAKRGQVLSQIVLSYAGGDSTGTLYSYTDAAQKGQISLKHINGGVRVEYVLGDRSARILVPRVIERQAFEDKIRSGVDKALEEGVITNREYKLFDNYFNQYFYATDASLSDVKRESMALQYPIVKEKNIDIYVCNTKITEYELRRLEAIILKCCPAYNFEELDNDHAYVNYIDEVRSPAVFKLALEYTLDENGLRVCLNGNGLRFDEGTYKITDLQILPYMGASLRTNEGYTFLPDGSGALYDLDTTTVNSSRIYGDDYALNAGILNYHFETMRMPVFGQVETDAKTGEKRGYLAIIEEGESLAKLTPNHPIAGAGTFTSVIPSFTTRQSDTSFSGWATFAERRYVDNYTIRYVMLSDDARAEKAGLAGYYECSWMGMACAYRDYLVKTQEGFDRLTASEVGSAIPLYIETFGCVDTIKKVLSIPVTLSVALTSFDQVGEMYDYLAGNNVKNVNFKLTGYANGGMYAEVPYKLKWEKAVGGKSDFKDLIAKAADEGFGLYPDFEFSYSNTVNPGRELNFKKHGARTVDNRYTSKREYSVTYQVLVSQYQMVLSPATFSHFYEKLEKRYAKYGAEGISLASLGDALNSDFNEDKTTLREESKSYVMQALSYFKDRDYDVMISGGNAFTWKYADHILNVPLDSSRYKTELTAVPFMGVALHGYVRFAGTAFNLEGNLAYAMLKAMENGASAYFVLSYANTELLKTYEDLSKNYSVRYDIWQQRLVEIYHELNSVLFDVQDKVIIGHETLNDSSNRVPDADELLKDIEQEAADKAAAIKDKINKDHIAKLTALRDAVNTVSASAGNINTMNSLVANSTNTLLENLKKDGNLIKAWEAYLAEPSESGLANLRTYINACVRSYTSVEKSMKSAITLVEQAKEAYILLRNDLAAASDEDKAAKEQVLAQAKTELIAAMRAYEALLNIYDSRTVTIADAAIEAYIASEETAISALTVTYTGELVTIANEDLAKFVFGADGYNRPENIAAREIYAAIMAQLKADDLYDAVDVKKLESDAGNQSDEQPDTPNVPGEGEGEGEDEGTNDDVVVPDPPKDKYAVDNNVVAVTYGADYGDPYKTLLLNFNDYTIRTTYNGVTYTIEAYGYVVITHHA